MEGEGDFVSTFGVNHKRICMCQCSFSVLSGPLDAGSYPSVVMIDTGCCFFMDPTVLNLYLEDRSILHHRHDVSDTRLDW